MPTKYLDYDKADIAIVANTPQEQRVRVIPQFKEPETVAWIDKYVQEGDTFFDVGANIGAYSFIAASRGATVYAFEPEAMNFGRLVQNIGLNDGLADRIFPFPCALWDRHERLTMHMQGSHPGAAMHNIGNGAKEEGRPFRQTIFTIRIDDLDTWDVPLPTHIKIDVDGYEANVLGGARNTLASPALRTVMCEVDTDRTDRDRVFQLLKSADLHLKESESRKHSSDVSNLLFVRHEML